MIEFPSKKIPLIARLVKASGLAGDGGSPGDDEGGVKAEVFQAQWGPAAGLGESWLAPLLWALLMRPTPMAAEAAASLQTPLPVATSSGLSKAAAAAINQIESQAAILEGGGVSAWSAEADIVSRSL